MHMVKIFTIKKFIVTALLLCLMSNFSYAQNDLEGPVISTYTVSPSNIDISSGPVTVTISIRATDTSGVVVPSAKPYIYSTDIAGNAFYFSSWTLVQGDFSQKSDPCLLSTPRTPSSFD